MIYTKKQYCHNFGIGCERTLDRAVKSGRLPSTHHVKRIEGRGYVIEVIGECKYCKAAIEYHVKSQSRADKWQCAMEFCVKYDLEVKRFCKIIGI